MKKQTESNLKFIGIVVLLAIGLFTILANAQSKDSLEEKLKNIKGDVEKIVITAGGSEYSFEGKEALKLFSKLKSNKIKKLNVTVSTDEDSDNGSNVFIISDDDDIQWVGDEESDFNWIEENTDGDSIVNKNINVEMEDGKKKITVKTIVNGEEKVETYEGEEAEEYFKNMKHGKSFNFNFMDDDDANVFILRNNKIKVKKLDGKNEYEFEIKTGDKSKSKKIIIKKEIKKDFDDEEENDND